MLAKFGDIMRYMQIEGGQKLHLVYEPGEGRDAQHLIPPHCADAALIKTVILK